MLTSADQNFIKFIELPEMPCVQPLASCGIDPTVSDGCDDPNAVLDNGRCRCVIGYLENTGSNACDQCDPACTNGCSGLTSADCTTD